MWDLPGPGLESTSLALAGRFLITAPPGKSQILYFYGGGTPKSLIGGAIGGGGLSLQSLFIGAASSVLWLHHLQQLGWAGEGLHVQGLKGFICPEVTGARGHAVWLV